ncbi:MAG TPA: class I SAM-dependent methyltransferase [Tepidisphaeraceae bacterium]|jgi:SAM-dependent methyltransferase|nr:class I SAM-dependent methyltransferase [Tepidisphaeraceae bacterium]
MTTITETPAAAAADSEQLVSAWDEVAQELTAIPLLLERARYAATIRPILHLPKAAEILEAGCGAGRILRTLDRMGYGNLTGLEISQARLNYIAQAGPRNAKLVCSSEVPFAANTFDAVLTAAAIEHVTDPRQWLKELARVTRPGGVISITTDTYMWKWLQSLGLYQTVQPLDGAIWPYKLAFWGRQAGLRLRACGGFVNVDRQRWYFLRQMKRLVSARRWYRKWKGGYARVDPWGHVPAVDEASIVDATHDFPMSADVDLQACVWAYECYYWFEKPAMGAMRLAA